MFFITGGGNLSVLLTGNANPCLIGQSKDLQVQQDCATATQLQQEVKCREVSACRIHSSYSTANGEENISLSVLRQPVKTVGVSIQA
jgi:hypothetical protein